MSIITSHSAKPKVHVRLPDGQDFSTIPSLPKPTRSLCTINTFTCPFLRAMTQTRIFSLRLSQPVSLWHPFRRILSPCLKDISPGQQLVPPYHPAPDCKHHGTLVCYCYSSDIPSIPHFILPYAVCELYFKPSRQAGRVIKCEVFQDEIC